MEETIIDAEVVEAPVEAVEAPQEAVSEEVEEQVADEAPVVAEDEVAE